MYIVLIVLLVIILLGVIPGGYGGTHFPQLATMGYFPGGIVGLLIIVLVVLLLTGRL